MKKNLQKSRGNKFRIGYCYKKIALYLILTITSLVSLFPIFWLISSSIKPPSALWTYPPQFFFIPTFEHYFAVIKNTVGFQWPLYWFNSAVVSSASVLLALLIGTIAAYGLAKFELKGKEIHFFLIASLRFMPPIVLLVPLYFYMSFLNLLDTRLGLIFLYTLWNLPFVVLIMRTFILDIPNELLEAALIDGCSELKAFFHIILPVIKPGFFTTSIICVIMSWNEFPAALILTGESAKTIPVAATTLVASMTIAWGELFSTATLCILPTLIFIIFIQKYLARGLTLGMGK